jgi:hypothetical protein
MNRKNTKIEVEIYGEATQTDNIIPKDSCHPYEHIISAINYLINRAKKKESKKERNENNTKHTKTINIKTIQ